MPRRGRMRYNYGDIVKFKKGQVVYEYLGYTYGSTTDDELVVTRRSGVTPFVGVPKNAVEWDKVEK